jgi:hypothetical protein
MESSNQVFIGLYVKGYPLDTDRLSDVFGVEPSQIKENLPRANRPERSVVWSYVIQHKGKSLHEALEEFLSNLSGKSSLNALADEIGNVSDIYIDILISNISSVIDDCSYAFRLPPSLLAKLSNLNVEVRTKLMFSED